MTLTTLNSNLDANHQLVSDAYHFDSNQLKLVNDANLLTLTKSSEKIQSNVSNYSNMYINTFM